MNQFGLYNAIELTSTEPKFGKCDKSYKYALINEIGGIYFVKNSTSKKIKKNLYHPQIVPVCMKPGCAKPVKIEFATENSKIIEDGLYSFEELHQILEKERGKRTIETTVLDNLEEIIY